MEQMRMMVIDGRTYRLIPTDNELVGTDYIIERLGIKRATLSRSPWHYPDFGVKMKGHKRIKPYTRTEVDSWLAIPSRIRRERYLEWRKENEIDE